MRGSQEVPPGWYPDPGGSPGLRWWDGRAWSQQTRPAEPPDTDDVPANEGHSHRRTGWLVALGLVIAAGVGAGAGVLLTGEATPEAASESTEEPADESTTEDSETADRSPEETAGENEPSASEPGSPSEDNELMALLDELPYQESPSLPFLVVGDLEHAWEVSSLDRPTDESDWIEGTHIGEHPFSGATGALPPGPEFIRSIMSWQERPFADLLGFGPIDVDRFATWHGGANWAATLRTDLGDVADGLADHPAWRHTATGDVEWFERTDEEEEYTNFRDALLVRDTAVVAGSPPDDVDPPRSPAALTDDPRRLSDVPGLPKLTSALEGAAVWAWIHHAPPVVDLGLESPRSLPEPYLAGAYASVVGDDGIRPTFVLVHDDEAAASANAAALEHNAANEGQEISVSREERVVWARTQEDTSSVVLAVNRANYEALDLVAPPD